MNGGDLHYHLTQHGVFSESEVRFYASEIILGLEHMHSRFVVYRDLKVNEYANFPALWIFMILFPAILGLRAMIICIDGSKLCTIILTSA